MVATIYCVPLAQRPDSTDFNPFRCLVEQVKELGLFLLDGEGRIISWNVGASVLTGFSESEVIGEKFPSCLIQAPPEISERPWVTLFESGQLLKSRLQLKRKDASHCTVEAAVSRIHQAQNGAQYSVVLRPVAEVESDASEHSSFATGWSDTAETLHQTLLKRREEQLIGLADNLPNGVIYQLEIAADGRRRTTYMSAGIERLLGVPYEEALADPNAGFDLIVPEDLAYVQHVEAAAIASQTLLDCEFRTFTRSGEVKWLHVRSKPRLEKDGITIWDGLTVDVTDRIRDRHRAEDAIRQSKSQLQLVIENLGEGLIILDLEGQILHCNPMALEFFECTAAPANVSAFREASQRVRLSSLDGQILDFTAGPLTRILQGDQLRDLEIRCQSVDSGVERILSCTGGIVGSNHDAPLAFLRFNDVTDQYRARVALRQSEESLIEAQRIAGIGSWMWDPATGSSLWSNEMYHIFGRDTQLPGLTNAEARRFYSRTSWNKLTEAAATTLKTGRSYVLDCEIRRPDGSRRWITVRGTAVRDRAGMITSLRGTVQDMTERIQAEWLRLAVTGAEIGTWHWDIFSGEVHCSSRCKQIFGIPTDEVINFDRFLQCLHPDDRDRTDLAIRSALETKTVYSIEVRCIWLDGSIHWTAAKGRGYYDKTGQPVRMEGAVLDITAQKNSQYEINQLNRDLAQRACEVEEANKELEAFSYSVSHDLRAPLRAIAGFSRIVVDDFGSQCPSEAIEYLQEIRASTQRMGKLLDDLLAFSRIGRESLNIREVNSEQIVRDCLHELTRDSLASPSEIQIGELASCHADIALLRQVWFNLLSNALKYSSNKRPSQIQIGPYQVQGGTGYFIRDNGVGFDMRYVHKLFGVFQRLHRAEDFEGTGVGLAIVQRILHRHGGRIWAEAAPNEGATFYFSLPR